jgi:hypothetical protein
LGGISGVSAVVQGGTTEHRIACFARSLCEALIAGVYAASPAR